MNDKSIEPDKQGHVDQYDKFYLLMGVRKILLPTKNKS